MNGHETTKITIDEYKEVAQECDLGLWRPTSWYGRVIARATHGPYSHICGIVDWDGELWELAYEEGRGGFGAPLVREALAFPGVIDLYRVTVPFDRKAVSSRMKKLRHDYNWSYIRTIAFLNAPFLRWFDHPLKKAERGSAGGICSSHMAFSFAEDDVFFQDGKALSEINPNDIYRSPITEYIGTLV